MTHFINTQIPHLTLRLATSADAELILHFIEGLAEYEKLSHEVATDAEQLRRELFGDHPAAEVVIADYDGHPAGFALFFHNFSTFLGQRGLYLEDLFVQPAFRGKGIGQALLTFLAKTAVERGYGRFEWSVLDWNEPAIGFYQKLGARPLDEWTTFRVTGEALSKLAATF